MMRFKARSLSLVIVVANLLSGLPGCAAPTFPRNWSQVKPGMTIKEVTELLGPPKKKELIRFPGPAFIMNGQLYRGVEERNILSWDEKDQNYSIQFVPGKVYHIGN